MYRHSWTTSTAAPRAADRPGLTIRAARWPSLGRVSTRTDILAAARAILVDHSLADLTMRRLATEIGVRPNALYWHYPNKQSLLAAVADDLLDEIGAPGPDGDPIAELAHDMRRTLLTVPDSAEIISSAWASGLGSRAVLDRFAALAEAAGLDRGRARGVATAVCQLVIGLTIEEQTRAQMERLGAAEPAGRDFDAEFDAGLQIILDGIRAAAQTG